MSFHQSALAVYTIAEHDEQEQRLVYAQRFIDGPSDRDLIIGMFDTPELARQFVRAYNLVGDLDREHSRTFAGPDGLVCGYDGVGCGEPAPCPTRRALDGAP